MGFPRVVGGLPSALLPASPWGWASSPSERRGIGCQACSCAPTSRLPSLLVPEPQANLETFHKLLALFGQVLMAGFSKDSRVSLAEAESV